MAIFDRLRTAIRNGVNRVAEGAELFKRDVFELDGVPAFREFYQLYIFVWQAIYKGFYKAWHYVPLKTINDPKGKRRTLATMNAGKMAASQLARYCWSERCDFSVSMEGWDSDEPDPLNEYLQEVLRQNSFGTGFGDLLEKAFAMGGGALKEWVEVPKDKDGNDIGPGRVRIGYHMAGQFVPTAWDNSKVKSAIFISREAREGFYYSTVEWHRYDGTSYRVTNELYRAPMKGTTEPQNILGWWYPLNLVYPLLSPATDFPEPRGTFFQYIRPFGANYADDNSPLGMSIFAPALDTLHGLDIIFDSLQREYTLGRKRIIVPARLIRKVPPVGGSGGMVSYFDADDEVYEALSTDTTEDLKIIDNSVDIRVQEHVDGINANLSILCGQIGLDPGVLSFDAQRGMKTATEVVSENSKTFGTVKANENGIKDALTDMVHAIFDLASRYDIEWEGRKVADLVKGGYNVNISFDDGITQDRQTNINEGISLVAAGLMSKTTFLTDPKYGQALTPEAAEAELARIGEERKIGPDVLDMMRLNTAE